MSCLGEKNLKEGRKRAKNQAGKRGKEVRIKGGTRR